MAGTAIHSCHLLYLVTSIIVYNTLAVRIAMREDSERIKLFSLSHHPCLSTWYKRRSSVICLATDVGRIQRNRWIRGWFQNLSWNYDDSCSFQVHEIHQALFDIRIVWSTNLKHKRSPDSSVTLHLYLILSWRDHKWRDDKCHLQVCSCSKASRKTFHVFFPLAAVGRVFSKSKKCTAQARAQTFHVRFELYLK